MLSFLIYFGYFCLVTILAFFVPGDLLVGKLKLKIWPRLALSFVVGMVLWSLFGLLFGYLNLRFLFYPYLFFALFWWVKKNESWFKKFKEIDFKKFDYFLIALLVLGTLTQLISVGFMGIKYADGMYFCCVVPDSLYHLGLTNELVKNFPPYEPGMSGVLVKNYHLLFNLTVADLVRIFKLPLIETQTQYFAFLLSVGLGASAWVFGELLGIGRSFVRWLVFFVYFAGDILYLFMFALGKGLDFDVRILHDSTKLWWSPPRVIALVVLLGGLSLLVYWIKKKNTLALWLSVLVMASLVGYKVYDGIFATIGFGFLGLFLVGKKRWREVWALMFFLLLAAIIYLPFNSGAGGLVWVGLWRFDDFIVRPEFELGRVELAKRIFTENKNYLRVVYHEIIYIFLYFLTIFGTLLLGFVQNQKSLKKFPMELNLFLIPAVVLSSVSGSLFFQKTGGANSGQFLIVVMTVLPIYAALSVSYWRKKFGVKVAALLTVIIVLLSGTRAVYETYAQIRFDLGRDIDNSSSLLVPSEELNALDFIRQNTTNNAVVLSDNVGRNAGNRSYYLSFLGNRSLFLTGDDILNDHGVDVSQRIKDRQIVFRSPYTSSVSAVLDKNKIDYIYMKSGWYLESTTSAQFLEPVYENNSVKILRIDKDKIKTVPMKNEVLEEEKILREYFKNHELPE